MAEPEHQRSEEAFYADDLTGFFNLIGRMDFENGQHSSNALLSMAATRDAISMVEKLQKVSETA